MKNPDFLLRIAQADAFGCSLEFVDPKKHLEHFNNVLKFDQYYERPNHRGWPGKGRYSDDTALSIATTEVLLNHSYPFTPLQFADSFVNVFHRDRREGYARGFQAFMEITHTGQDFLERIQPDSDKNGAAMRSVPLGILPDEEQVLNTAKLQAKVTHDTEGGIFSSQAVALLSHYALYDKGKMNKKAFKKYANKFGMDLRAFDEVWKWPVVGPHLGVKTFHAAYELVMNNWSMMNMLKYSVCGWSHGPSDYDSLFAIAWGIASFRDKGKNIPEWMCWNLEIGKPYGVYFLQTLGKQLMEKYNVPRT